MRTFTFPNVSEMKRIATLLALFLLSLASANAQIAAPSPVQIPDNRVSILDFGAVTDGSALNTVAFEKAISALNKQGGGRLIVPEGLYLTGPISLKDCIDLHLEKGAVILFSPDKTLYLKDGSVKPGISVSKRHDVSISGQGIIDGNGAFWRPVKRGKVSDTEWKVFQKMGGELMQEGQLWYPFNLTGYENIAADAQTQERMRTHLVRFTDCERVSVTGVTLQNAPKFHLVPSRCKDVTIEGVTVRCPWNAQNGDGIDLMQCERVVVRNCTVDVGDDGICLKGGNGTKSLKDGPCKDILIEYNTVYHAHGGFVIGSEFCAGMENITVRHNVFSGTDTGLRFKSAPERGGITRNIRISNIVMNDIRDEAIVFETSYADRPAGQEGNQAARSLNFVPDFQDIVMERISCWGAAVGIKASGTLEMIHDITVKDAVLYVKEGTKIDVPQMIRLENVQITEY